MSKVEDFNSETDSDYASYWRDWVIPLPPPSLHPPVLFPYERVRSGFFFRDEH